MAACGACGQAVEGPRCAACRAWAPGLAVGAFAAAPPPAAGAGLGWYPLDGVARWWDGAAWSAAPPPEARRPHRSLRVLGTTTSVLLLASAGATVAAGAAAIGQAVAAGRVEATWPHRPEVLLGHVDQLAGWLALAWADRRAALAHRACLVLFALTAVSFLIWLHRAFGNLQRAGSLRARRVEHSPWSAVGWWFVPVANLIWSKLVLDEALGASLAPDVLPKDRPPPVLVTRCWLVAGGAGLLWQGSAFLHDLGAVGLLPMAHAIEAAVAAALALAAGLMVRIVWTTSAAQDDRAAALDRLERRGTAPSGAISRS